MSGVLRGLIYPNSQVTEGMKVGDIDPRGIREYCFTVSDKALSVEEYWRLFATILINQEEVPEKKRKNDFYFKRSF